MKIQWIADCFQIDVCMDLGTEVEIIVVRGLDNNHLYKQLQGQSQIKDDIVLMNFTQYRSLEQYINEG